MKALVLAPIRLYQRLLSPLIPARCKYHPSCSEYAVQAVRAHGPIGVLVLAGWRLLRCKPLSNGGIDRVEDQRVFKAPPVAH